MWDTSAFWVNLNSEKKRSRCNFLLWVHSVNQLDWMFVMRNCLKRVAFQFPLPPFDFTEYACWCIWPLLVLTMVAEHTVKYVQKQRRAHCFVLLFEALMEEFMEVLLPDIFDNEGQTFCWFFNHIENLICVQNWSNRVYRPFIGHTSCAHQYFLNTELNLVLLRSLQFRKGWIYAVYTCRGYKSSNLCDMLLGVVLFSTHELVKCNISGGLKTVMLYLLCAFSVHTC